MVGGTRLAAGASLAADIERFNFEKGETRGGGTAPHGQKRAEKLRFFCETTGHMVCNAQCF